MRVAERPCPPAVIFPSAMSPSASSRATAAPLRVLRPRPGAAVLADREADPDLGQDAHPHRVEPGRDARGDVRVAAVLAHERRRPATAGRRGRRAAAGPAARRTAAGPCRPRRRPPAPAPRPPRRRRPPTPAEPIVARRLSPVTRSRSATISLGESLAPPLVPHARRSPRARTRRTSPPPPRRAPRPAARPARPRTPGRSRSPRSASRGVDRRRPHVVHRDRFERVAQAARGRARRRRRRASRRRRVRGRRRTRRRRRSPWRQTRPCTSYLGSGRGGTPRIARVSAIVAGVRPEPLDQRDRRPQQLGVGRLVAARRSPPARPGRARRGGSRARPARSPTTSPPSTATDHGSPDGSSSSRYASSAAGGRRQAELQLAAEVQLHDRAGRRRGRRGARSAWCAGSPARRSRCWGRRPAAALRANMYSRSSVGVQVRARCGGLRAPSPSLVRPTLTEPGSTSVMPPSPRRASSSTCAHRRCTGIPRAPAPIVG